MGIGILTKILLAPAVGLILVLLIPARKETFIRWVSLLVALVTILLSISVFLEYDLDRGGMQLDSNDKMVWIKSGGITYHNAVDGLNIPLIFLTAIVIFCGVLSSWHGIQTRVKEFHALMLFLVTGVFGVYMTQDMFFFFVFYEIAVLPMYILILIWGSTRKEYASMKLTLYLIFGSAFIFVGILALYIHTGYSTTNLHEIKKLLIENPPSDLFTYTVFPLLFIGFGILAGLWPFHTWSPDGHVAAPTAASMLHAGVLMKLGAYGIMRIAIYLLPEGLVFWAEAIMVLSLVNIVYGAFVAMAQTDLKYVIGYSSVSHMGLVIFGLSMMNEEGFLGASYQMFAHGVMTALFFACVGAIYDRAHTRRISDFGGIFQKMPVVCASFMCAGLAGLGLPGFSGFVAEFLVFWGAFKAHPYIAAVALTSIVLTAYYVLRLFQKAFFGTPNPKWDSLTDSLPAQNTAYAVLIGTMLIFGIWPRIFLDIMRPAVQDLLKLVTGP